MLGHNFERALRKPRMPQGSPTNPAWLQLTCQRRRHEKQSNPTLAFGNRLCLFLSPLQGTGLLHMPAWASVVMLCKTPDAATSLLQPEPPPKDLITSSSGRTRRQGAPGCRLNAPLAPLKLLWPSQLTQARPPIAPSDMLVFAGSPRQRLSSVSGRKVNAALTRPSDPKSCS